MNSARGVNSSREGSSAGDAALGAISSATGDNKITKSRTMSGNPFLAPPEIMKAPALSPTND